MFPNQPGTVVAVAGAWAAKNQEAVQKLVAGIVEATRIIQKEPARAAGRSRRRSARASSTARPSKRRSSPASKFASDPRAIIDSFAAMQAYQVKIGSLDKEYPLDGLFDASYYLKATGK